VPKHFNKILTSLIRYLAKFEHIKNEEREIISILDILHAWKF